jgi:hypothetical protein
MLCLSSLVLYLWVRPRVEQLKGASLVHTQAIPANIRLGLEILLGTNTLAIRIRKLRKKMFNYIGLMYHYAECQKT